MKINRESGRALTLNDLIKPFKILAIFIAALLLSYVVIAGIPDPEITWTVQDFEEDDSFAIFPLIMQKNHSLGFIHVWEFQYVKDRYDEAVEAYNYCSGLFLDINDKRPFRLEGQYIVEDGAARIAVQGYYTENGETVDFFREFPLNHVYFKDSDFGPMQYTDKLLYIPEEIRQERLIEINKNRAEIEDLKKNGTSLRKHKVFYTALFTLISIAAIYMLLRYYKKYHPVFRLDCYCSGSDPSADFYYAVPIPRLEAKLFGKIYVEPADHLKIAYFKASRAFDDIKKICESHREDLPARFEGTYFPTAEGSVIELRGFYTQNGERKDITERVRLETALFAEAFIPEAPLRPDLSWKWESGKKF